jgi:hypothetical protein
MNERLLSTKIHVAPGCLSSQGVGWRLGGANTRLDETHYLGLRQYRVNKSNVDQYYSTSTGELYYSTE